MTTFLLLHGFTGAPESFDAITARLPTDARVIAPMLAGHGPTPARVGSWDEEVHRLENRLEAEDATDVHVVGYSLGGRLGWSLATRSSRVAQATLIGAHPGLTNEAERIERRASDAEWVERLRRDGLTSFVDEWQSLPLWASQRGLSDRARERRRQIRLGHTAEGLAQVLEQLGLAEMPAPHACAVRLNLVVGESDARHRALAARAVERLGSVRRTVVRDAGHDVVLERPDRIAALLGLSSLRRAS